MPLPVWVGLVQSAEGHTRKRLTSPEEEGIVPANGLWTHPPSTLPWVSSLIVYLADYGLASHDRRKEKEL